MQRLMTMLTRFMPLMFCIIVIISILQFLNQHPLDPQSTVRSVQLFLIAHWAFVLVAAAFLWLLAAFGFYHEKHAAQAAPQAPQRSWDKDVLDRLTNRISLEGELQQVLEPTFIDADELSTKLKRRLIGQDDVCDEVAAQLRRRLALRQRGKPVGVFLLAGPPGTGKTYLAKQLALVMRIKLVHLDMTQFARGGAASTQLFGSSKGYVGSDSYGKLTSAMKESPTALVLLDEFEKAHAEVHKNFLTAWNDGFITEASDGRQISTTQAIFILTTNAAVDVLSEASAHYASGSDQMREVATQALLDAGFAPELLNRIDRIFTFKPLSGLDVARVSALEIEAMVENYGLEIAEGGIDPAVLTLIIRRHQQAGARASTRDIVRGIEDSIADSLIEAKRRGAKQIVLQVSSGHIEARSAEPREQH